VLSQISDIESESVGANSPDDGKLGNGNVDSRFYGPGLPYGSWNDPSHFAENFSVMKREQDNDTQVPNLPFKVEFSRNVLLVQFNLNF
jgi:hypothetical protein